VDGVLTSPVALSTINQIVQSGESVERTHVGVPDPCRAKRVAEVTQTLARSIDRHPRVPLSTLGVPTHPNKARLVVRTLATIATLLSGRRRTQIFSAIVQAILVLMIDLAGYRLTQQPEHFLVHWAKSLTPVWELDCSPRIKGLAASRGEPLELA
jgi:hypothetical protein